MGPRVGLVGFFGWGNFGDELFYHQWQSALGVDQTFRVNDLLQRPYMSVPASDVAKQADAIVIGGGDLIRTESISALYWNRAWTDRPIAIAGIGVAQESGRIRSDVVPRLRSFMESARILSFSVRDPDSKAWVEENLNPPCEVRLVSDLAYAEVSLRKPVAYPGHLHEKPTVGVVLNKSITHQDVLVLEYLMESEAAGVINLRVLVLAAGVQLDQEIDQLRKFGYARRAETFAGVAEMISAISGVDLLYSAKFHGLVVGSALGIPVRSLRNTSKARGLAVALNEPRISLSSAVATVPDNAALNEEAGGLSETVPGLTSAAVAEIDHVSRVLAAEFGPGLS